MAVEYASPSGDVQRIALRGFQDVARAAQTGRVRAAGLPLLPLTGATLSAPHQVHHVGLRQLVAGHPLKDSAVTGWRYLVRTDEAAVASSEISIGSDSRPPMLEQINMGPYVPSTASALERLDAIPELESGRYEPHFLKIPALSTYLLWLHQLDGDADLFMVLPPAPEFLDAGRLYREEELLNLLQAPARRCLTFDTSPSDGYGTAE